MAQGYCNLTDEEVTRCPCPNCEEQREQWRAKLRGRMRPGQRKWERTMEAFEAEAERQRAEQEGDD